MDDEDNSSVEALGGRAAILEVARVLYHKVFEHPRLKLLFVGSEEEAIAQKVTSFMYSAMGGQEAYRGLPPKAVHKHMFISHSLYEDRKALLVEAFQQTRQNPILLERWLNIDEAFKGVIVKSSISECQFSSESFASKKAA